eukprot:220575-Pelagomonas_calceolata.AAC.4
MEKASREQGAGMLEGIEKASREQVSAQAATRTVKNIEKARLEANRLCRRGFHGAEKQASKD